MVAASSEQGFDRGHRHSSRIRPAYRVEVWRMRNVGQHVGTILPLARIVHTAETAEIAEYCMETSYARITARLVLTVCISFVQR